ncbi:MAG: toxin [Kiritimatiellae bacterium]|nr:toxin [Kiritimatiellia bacterium]
MNTFIWNESKNELLKCERDVCFEQIVILMEQGKFLEVIDHPNQIKYRGQKIAIFEIDRYAYLVPYEQHENSIELKTIIPSRKATKKYLGDTNERNPS